MAETNLESEIRAQGILPVAEAVDIIVEIAAELAEKHEVLLFDGAVSSASILIVRGVGGAARLRPNQSLAAPSKRAALYRAPEQLEGAAGDATADVWSLAVVLYEAISGRLPFASSGEIERAVFTPLRARRNACPPQVEMAVTSCLQRDPRARTQNIVDFALAIAPSGGSRSLALVPHLQSMRGPSSDPTLSVPPLEENVLHPADDEAPTAHPADDEKPTRMHPADDEGPTAHPSDDEGPTANTQAPQRAKADSFESDDTTTRRKRRVPLDEEDDKTQRISTAQYQELSRLQEESKQKLAVAVAPAKRVRVPFSTDDRTQRISTAQYQELSKRKASITKATQPVSIRYAPSSAPGPPAAVAAQQANVVDVRSLPTAPGGALQPPTDRAPKEKKKSRGWFVLFLVVVIMGGAVAIYLHPEWLRAAIARLR